MPGAYLWGWDATPGAEGWRKILVNAEGKLIIDPSEIFENPPTEDEAGKAPTSEWAFDHDADGGAHHPAPIDDPENKEVIIPFGGGGGGGFPSNPPEGYTEITNIYMDLEKEEQVLET